MVITSARQSSTRPSASSSAAILPSRRAKAVGFGFDHREIRRLSNQPLHRLAIEFSIGLRARALDSGTLAAVQHTKLDTSRIGGQSHQTVERVDFTHEMALAEAADRRIARHGADRIEALRHQGGFGAETRRRRRRLAAGMSAANDDNIETVHVFHPACFT